MSRSNEDAVGNSYSQPQSASPARRAWPGLALRGQAITIAYTSGIRPARMKGGIVAGRQATPEADTIEAITATKRVPRPIVPPLHYRGERAKLTCAIGTVAPLSVLSSAGSYPRPAVLAFDRLGVHLFLAVRTHTS